jgi:hypothetical protein
LEVAVVYPHALGTANVKIVFVVAVESAWAHEGDVAQDDVAATVKGENTRRVAVYGIFVIDQCRTRKTIDGLVLDSCNLDGARYLDFPFQIDGAWDGVVTM